MYQGLSQYIDQVMPTALASGLFTATCTIQQPVSGTAGFDTGGAPTGDYVAVAGMVNIPCMDAPMVVIAPKSDEFKSLEAQLSTQPRHILLGGSYPTIADHNDWQAVITEATGQVNVYDILGAENDSQGTQTRIAGRLASI